MRNVIVIGQVCLLFLNLFQGQYEEKDLSPESEPGEFGLGWGQVIDPWEVSHNTFEGDKCYIKIKPD